MRVLIIMDAQHICQDKRNEIKWRSIGITEVRFVSNGREALTILEGKTYDAILIDMECGGMSGTEFMEKARQSGIGSCFILLSGQESYEYAKAGIEYGADGYLLKPVCPEELRKVMQKIEYKIKYSMEAYNNRNQINAYNRYQTVKHIIQKKITEKKQIKSFLQEQCGFGQLQVFMGLVIRDDKEIYRLDTEENIRQATYKSLEKYLAGYEYTTFLMGGDEAFILFNVANSTLRIFHLKLQIRKMMDALNREAINGSVSGGVSETGGLTDIPRLYETAQIALEYRFCYGNGSCLEYRSCIEDDEQKAAMPSDEWNEKILKIVESGEEQDLIDVVQECRKELFGSKKERIQVFILENMYLVNEKYSMGMTKNQMRDSILEISRFDELMLEWTEYLCEILRLNCEKSKYHYETHKALEYIRTHYADRITVEEIADYLSVSEGHFSRMFKREMGMSFVKYLNQYRLDKAEELLCNSNMKIYEIAEKVGIPDYSYFAQVFRKIKGKSPMELRK